MRKSNKPEQLFSIYSIFGEQSIFRFRFKTYYEFCRLIESEDFSIYLLSFFDSFFANELDVFESELKHFSRVYLQAFKVKESVRFEYSRFFEGKPFHVCFVKAPKND